MAERWTLYLAVAVLVAVAVELFRGGAAEVLRNRRSRRARFAGLAPGTAPAGIAVVRRPASGFAASPLGASLDRLVVQSGVGWGPGRLAAAALALALAAYALLPAPPGGALRAAVAAVTGVGLVGAWLLWRRARRLKRFGEQLPDVLDVIVRSLRAGHPLVAALGLVARETPEPAGPEFAAALGEIQYGRSVTEALDGLSARIGHPELRYFAAAVSIAHQTGGNLGEILGRLSRTLRERARLARKVRALSAEGRFSGYALSVLPVALFGILNLVSPAYYRDFWASDVAPTVLAVAAGLLAVGNLVILRLVRFRV